MSGKTGKKVSRGDHPAGRGGSFEEQRSFCGKHGGLLQADAPFEPSGGAFVRGARVDGGDAAGLSGLFPAGNSGAVAGGCLLSAAGKGTVRVLACKKAAPGF